jgi:hypothetical protein
MQSQADVTTNLNEAVAKPLHIFDTSDDRSLIEHCCLKESKPA